MVIAHLLMTRFAVQVGDHPPSSRWIESRWDLFERYCLPSVLAQTFRDFRWLIYIAPAVSEAIADRLRAYDPRIEVRRDSHKDSLDVEADVLVTTRLDSDDALAATALKRVQAIASRPTTATLVDFPNGYYVHHQRQKAYVGRGAAFKSLIEPTTRVGVYVQNCDVIGKSFPAITIAAPAWLRVVHGGNVTNRFNLAKKSFPLADIPRSEFPCLA